MTIYRVNTDRDQAQVVWDHRIYKARHRYEKKDCLSAISMHYYKTFKLWYNIWADNYSVCTENPNIVAPGTYLLIRHRNLISPEEVATAHQLFSSWNLFPTIAQVLKNRKKNEADWARWNPKPEEPEWAKWNPPSQEPDWARWNSEKK